MFCSACGKAARWRCPGCGTLTAATWLLLTGLLAWTAAAVGSVMYLWKLIPTVAAFMEGLGEQLELVTRLHIVAVNWIVRLFLFLLVPAAFVWWVRRHGPGIAAMGAFAALGVLALAFCLLASYGGLYSVVVHFPSPLRAQIALDEQIAIRDLRRLTRTGAPIDCANVPDPSLLGARYGYVRECADGLYRARPQELHRSGVRAFVVDASGRVCASPDGTIPKHDPACKEAE